MDQAKQGEWMPRYAKKSTTHDDLHRFPENKWLAAARDDEMPTSTDCFRTAFAASPTGHQLTRR